MEGEANTCPEGKNATHIIVLLPKRAKFMIMIAIGAFILLDSLS